jgi:hypothetical protein
MVLDVGVGCFRFFNNSKSNKPSWKTVWTQASTASSIIFLFSHFPPYFHMVGPMHFSFLSFQIIFLLFLSFLITYFPFFLPTIFCFFFFVEAIFSFSCCLSLSPFELPVSQSLNPRKEWETRRSPKPLVCGRP